MPFPYKNVLVTGATSGIGRALAERMIANGIFVIAVGRRQDRLDELVAKHGSDKVAAEAFDISNLDALGPWAKKITTTYPKLDSIVLNAGFQRSIDFTKPETVALSTVTSEIQTNYLSPLHTVTHFLPHLTSLGPSTSASIILVSSGLALVPIPVCVNYCASKAAIHSFAWSLRAQLSSPRSPQMNHIRVIEIIPPAVQTELMQPDLAAAGFGKFSLPLEPYVDETWSALQGEADLDEVMCAVLLERFGHIEDEKKKAFQGLVAALAKQGA
ncbi:NAD(P)-binding protein [Thozetella sp. PMI_491]|nr:NAD(P)-binding protein [Thozetella sp. PMI_491]